MEINGISNAKQRPLAAETPILSPVYDPGPILTETASKVFESIPASVKTCSI